MAGGGGEGIVLSPEPEFVFTHKCQIIYFLQLLGQFFFSLINVSIFLKES